MVCFFGPLSWLLAYFSNMTRLTESAGCEGCLIQMITKQEGGIQYLCFIESRRMRSCWTPSWLPHMVLPFCQAWMWWYLLIEIVSSICLTRIVDVLRVLLRDSY